MSSKTMHQNGGESPVHGNSGHLNNQKNDEDEVYIKRVLENFREQASSKKFVNLKDVYQILEKVEDKLATGMSKSGGARLSTFRANPTSSPTKTEFSSNNQDQGRDFR